MSKFCYECIHWEKVIPQLSGDTFGICQSTAVGTKIAVDGKTHLDEGGALWTAQYFGCVHWNKKSNEVVNFDDIIDSENGKIK